MHESFIEFQNQFIAQFEQYQKLVQQLDDYRGKEIDQEIDTVNELLLNIQKTFESLYPMMAFIAKNSAICAKSINDYNIFLEDMQKAGAQRSVASA